ncbi:hypothetical protein ACQP00_22130 [Dactylosporangium sp. CS-047395]|uniref:hypothetical protein n=1 Tax=Dactylosporangium sp. CS-047395 TaxID=3239936 RepID=UPI003D9432C8
MSTSDATATVVDPVALRRTIVAAEARNMVEWFDFGAFSYIAVTLGAVFFPEASASAEEWDAAEDGDQDGEVDLLDDED